MSFRGLTDYSSCIIILKTGGLQIGGGTYHSHKLETKENTLVLACKDQSSLLLRKHAEREKSKFCDVGKVKARSKPFRFWAQIPTSTWGIHSKWTKLTLPRHSQLASAQISNNNSQHLCSYVNSIALEVPLYSNNHRHEFLAVHGLDFLRTSRDFPGSVVVSCRRLALN